MANYELKKGVKNRLCNKSNKHAAIHPYLNTLCNFPNAINELVLTKNPCHLDSYLRKLLKYH